MSRLPNATVRKMVVFVALAVLLVLAALFAEHPNPCADCVGHSPLRKEHPPTAVCAKPC